MAKKSGSSDGGSKSDTRDRPSGGEGSGSKSGSSRLRSETVYSDTTSSDYSKANRSSEARSRPNAESSRTQSRSERGEANQRDSRARDRVDPPRDIRTFSTPDYSPGMMTFAQQVLGLDKDNAKILNRDGGGRPDGSRAAATYLRDFTDFTSRDDAERARAKGVDPQIVSQTEELMALAQALGSAGGGAPGGVTRERAARPKASQRSLDALRDRAGGNERRLPTRSPNDRTGGFGTKGERDKAGERGARDPRSRPSAARERMALAQEDQLGTKAANRVAAPVPRERGGPARMRPAQEDQLGVKARNLGAPVPASRGRSLRPAQVDQLEIKAANRPGLPAKSADQALRGGLRAEPAQGALLEQLEEMIRRQREPGEIGRDATEGVVDWNSINRDLFGVPLPPVEAGLSAVAGRTDDPGAYPDIYALQRFFNEGRPAPDLPPMTMDVSEEPRLAPSPELTRPGLPMPQMADPYQTIGPDGEWETIYPEAQTAAGAPVPDTFEGVRGQVPSNIIYAMLGEAAGEGAEGLNAVAHVILNRSRSGRYPEDPLDVVEQPKQFSAFNEVGEGGNDPWSRFSPQDPLYRMAEEIYLAAQSGDSPDPTGGAIHYWAGNDPYWKDDEMRRAGVDGADLVDIGGHTFIPQNPIPPADIPEAAGGPEQATIWDNVVSGAGRVFEETPIGGIAKKLFPEFWEGAGEYFKGLDDTRGETRSGGGPRRPAQSVSDSGGGTYKPPRDYDLAAYPYANRDEQGTADTIWVNPATGIQGDYNGNGIPDYMEVPGQTPGVTLTPGVPPVFPPGQYPEAVFPFIPPYRPGFESEWDYFREQPVPPQNPDRFAPPRRLAYADGGMVNPGGGYRPGVDPEWDYFPGPVPPRAPDRDSPPIYRPPGGGTVTPPGTPSTPNSGPGGGPPVPLYPGATQDFDWDSYWGTLTDSGGWPEGLVGGRPTQEQWTSAWVGRGYTPRFAHGGYVGYASGGGVDGGMDPRVEIIAEAEQALRGQHPNPEQAIQVFIDAFGEEALSALYERIMAEMGEMKNDPARLIEGPGGPEDDMVPARINDTQEARLSDGEFVMTADAVQNAGDGDRNVGAQKLLELNDMLSGKNSQMLDVDRVQ